ncbi:MAG: nodulation protein NfeD [Gemmataceae bacterium]|nr:nodulation protein NfeD [Gemmataceae bacterium]
MHRLLTLVVVLSLSTLLIHRAWAEERPSKDRPVVLQIRLDDQAITPVTARFLERAIQQAERERAECLVLILDTPGGLVDSTRRIVRDMLGSEVPVVVYVAPSGARAASAGVFITLAGHVAAMAPGTNIGAAYPVQVGGLPGSPPPEQERKGGDRSAAPLKEKIVNDTVAWARSLAELRGRNADWAARAVKESISVSASAAVKEGVVDLLAEDIEDLLAKIHGRSVTLPSGTVSLNTRSAEVRALEMWWGERLLGVLSNPTVAFLLLIFGFYGILFELYSPGWGVAGTLGVVCLVLAFFSLAVLPVNYAGLGLIALALALFVAEVFVTSYGFLSLGGVVCLVLGGLMLVESPAGFQRISLGALVPVALATAAITVFLVGSIWTAHRGRVQTGGEALVGAEAVALEDFSVSGEGYTGMVRVRGELWRAIAPASVAAGHALEVRGQEGLTLLVQPAWPPNGVVSTSDSVRHSESQ